MLTTKPFTFDRVIRLLIGLTVVVLLFLLLKRLSDVLLPFLIAWLIAYMLDPIVRFFQFKLRFKNRILSVAVTLILLLAVIYGVGFELVALITDEVKKVIEITSKYSDKLYVSSIIPIEWQNEINSYFLSMNLNDLLQNKEIMNMVKSAAPQVWHVLDGSVNLLLSLTVSLVVLMYTVFILIDYDRITDGMLKIIPGKYQSIITEVLNDLQAGMNSYFRGQSLVALIVGILFAIGFSIIGLPMAIVFGLFIGALTMVPYLKIIALIPAALLGVLQYVEASKSISTIFISIAVVFIVVQVFEDMFLTPAIMKRVTGLNPAVILLALSVWGSLMGIVGLIIALPLTTLIISYYKRFVLNDLDSDEVQTTAPTDINTDKENDK